MLGKTISHYKILEQLGQGGMGIVYKAQDTRLKRSVAIKFLSPDIALQEPERERFLTEARATAALNHPNLATIHTIDEVDDELFIVMEFIDGPSLKKLIEEGPLALDTAIAIAAQVAAGMQAAHERGIIHRDLKPANIMLTAKGQAKIMDFGLAKMSETSSLTKAGTTLGTATYMSPEQAQGLETDQRTDVWALGVVLYEMITGRLPFQGEYEQALYYAIVNLDPKSVTALRPDVPVDFERIVNRALVKNREERYQKMEEMLAALQSLQKNLASTPAPTAKATAASIVVLPFADLSPQKDQEYFCDGMAEELINVFAKIENLHVVSRTSAFAFKGKDLDIRNIGERLKVSHALEGSVRKAGNRLRITAKLINVANGFQLWSEKYERELDDVFAIQDDIAAAIVKKLKMKLTGEQESRLVKRYTENPDAYNLYLQARFHLNRRTEEGLRKGVAYCEQAIALDPAYALAYAGLADGFALLGFQGFLPPKEAMPQSKAAAEKALTIDDTLAEAHTSLGCVRAIHDWHWRDSEQEFLRALELNPNGGAAHYWYALWNLLPTGQFQKCQAEIKKAMELDPLSLVLKAGIGWQYYFARQFDLAVAALEKTLEMDEYFLFAHDLLGQAYLQKGMHEQAIAEMEKAVALSHRRTLSLGTLGHAYATAARNKDAQSILDELLERAQQKYVSAYDVALIYAGMGENEQALAWLEKAYEEHNGWLVFLKVEPRLDALHAEARFNELLNSVGLQK